MLDPHAVVATSCTRRNRIQRHAKEIRKLLLVNEIQLLTPFDFFSSRHPFISSRSVLVLRSIAYLLLQIIQNGQIAINHASSIEGRIKMQPLLQNDWINLPGYCYGKSKRIWRDK